VHQNLENYLGGLKRLIFQINNGIDLNEIAQAKPYPKSKLGFDNTTTLLLQVSSFTSQKDQKTLIKSLEHLPDTVHLILVGEGPLKEVHEEFSSTLKYSERIHFFGLRKDVPSLLKTVDIVVLSSNFEGLSLSCVEGLASGRPFVASDVPGLKEVVEGYGVLFPKADHTILASKIMQLLDDSEYYDSSVASCLLRSKDFDIKDMVSNYLKTYEETI